MRLDWNASLTPAVSGPDVDRLEIWGCSPKGYRAVLLGSIMYRVKVHYCQEVKRKLPCPGPENCRLCKAAMGGYPQGYIAAMWPGRCTPFVVELTTAAARMVQDAVNQGEQLRGQVLRVFRAGKGKQGRVAAHLEGAYTAQALLPEFDPRFKLLHFWGLPHSDPDKLHLVPGEALIEYDRDAYRKESLA